MQVSTQRKIYHGSAIVIFSLLFLGSIVLFASVDHPRSNENWDLLIFTQHWPNTVCLLWEEKTLHKVSGNHTCSFPRHQGVWSIHGIWPTKLGTKGPIFCNTSYHFNSSQLEPIETNLTDYWVDIERPSTKYAFWRHEWRKHGTCATVLPQLDTEVKYFTQGLEWIQQYNMADVLGRGGVLASDERGYKLSVLWNAVTRVLGKNPDIQCVKDSVSGQWFIFELRICFNKILELTDCDGIKLSNNGFWKSNMITNCPEDLPIQYPNTLPSPKKKTFTKTSYR
uniref:Uncharacterized protein n=1 Tax=Clastoptera arizonana TaxID=38151 RepID=A0A1B6DBJ7_9HEMI